MGMNTVIHGRSTTDLKEDGTSYAVEEIKVTNGGVQVTGAVTNVTAAEYAALSLAAADAGKTYRITDGGSAGDVYEWNGTSFDLVQSGGAAKVTQATLLAGEDQTNDVLKVEQQYAYSYITTAATTDLAQAAGAFLHCITILNATLTGTVTIYDESTGGTTLTVGVIPVSAVGGTYFFDAVMTQGLQIVTSSASDDIVVSYRT